MRIHDGKYWGHDTMPRIHSQKPKRSSLGWKVFAGIVIAAIAVAVVVTL